LPANSPDDLLYGADAIGEYPFGREDARARPAGYHLVLEPLRKPDTDFPARRGDLLDPHAAALDPQNNCEEEIAVIRIGRAVGSIPPLQNRSGEYRLWLNVVLVITLTIKQVKNVVDTIGVRECEADTSVAGRPSRALADRAVGALREQFPAS
jgi:hypothetical protein